MNLFFLPFLFCSSALAGDAFPPTVHSPDSILKVAFQSTRNYIRDISEQVPLKYDPANHSLTILNSTPSACTYQFRIEIIRATKVNSIEENMKLTNCKGEASYIYVYREGNDLEETPDDDLFNLKFPQVSGTRKYILDIPLINFRMDYTNGSATFVTTQKFLGKTTVFFGELQKADESFRRWRFVFESTQGLFSSPTYMAQSFAQKIGGRNLVYTSGTENLTELAFSQKFTISIVGFLTQYFFPSILNEFIGLPQLNQSISISISY